MSYNFKNLAEVELLAEVPEGCTAFAEVDGVVKRVPSKGLGGEGGIKTAIIKHPEYDNTLAGLQAAIAAAPITYECINMTFEEAYQIMASGEPLACLCMDTNSNGYIFNGYALVVLDNINYSVPTIIIEGMGDIYWTEEGLSTETPS